MEDTSLVALAGLSLSGYSFEQHPEMVSYVRQVSSSYGGKKSCGVQNSIACTYKYSKQNIVYMYQHTCV